MKKHNFCNQTNKARLIDCHRSAEHCCATLMEGIMYLLLGDPSIFSNYSTVPRLQNWSFILCCCSRCTLQSIRLLKESHCHTAMWRMQELWENSMVVSSIWSRSYIVRDFIQKLASLDRRMKVPSDPNLSLDQENVQDYLRGVYCFPPCWRRWNGMTEAEKELCMRTKMTALEEQGEEKDIEAAIAKCSHLEVGCQDKLGWWPQFLLCYQLALLIVESFTSAVFGLTGKTEQPPGLSNLFISPSASSSHIAVQLGNKVQAGLRSNTDPNDIPLTERIVADIHWESHSALVQSWRAARRGKLRLVPAAVQTLLFFTFL